MTSLAVTKYLIQNALTVWSIIRHHHFHDISSRTPTACSNDPQGGLNRGDHQQQTSGEEVCTVKTPWKRQPNIFETTNQDAYTEEHRWTGRIWILLSIPTVSCFKYEASSYKHHLEKQTRSRGVLKFPEIHVANHCSICSFLKIFKNCLCLGWSRETQLLTSAKSSAKTTGSWDCWTSTRRTQDPECLAPWAPHHVEQYIVCPEGKKNSTDTCFFQVVSL